MTPPANPTPATSWSVGEAAAHKPLGKFGSALPRSPVRDGRAEADQADIVELTTPLSGAR